VKLTYMLCVLSCCSVLLFSSVLLFCCILCSLFLFTPLLTWSDSYLTLLTWHMCWHSADADTFVDLMHSLFLFYSIHCYVFYSINVNVCLIHFISTTHTCSTLRCILPVVTHCYSLHIYTVTTFTFTHDIACFTFLFCYTCVCSPTSGGLVFCCLEAAGGSAISV
jgi:hypothetical protein